MSAKSRFLYMLKSGQTIRLVPAGLFLTLLGGRSMRESQVTRSVLGLLTLSVVLSSVAVGSQRSEGGLQSNIVGTWRLVSGKYGDTEMSGTPLAGATTLKHVTPSQFTWLSYKPDTGVVFRAAGGTYTIKGNTYIEWPQYGFSPDFEIVKGKQHSFTIRIEGDKWYSSGSLADGTGIEEVWERIK